MKKKCKRGLIIDKAIFVRNILILTVVIFTITFLMNNYFGKSANITKTITVQYGDTLWSIANSLESEENIQNVILEIKRINNMENSMVYAGQNIQVPIG